MFKYGRKSNWLVSVFFPFLLKHQAAFIWLVLFFFKYFFTCCFCLLNSGHLSNAWCSVCIIQSKDFSFPDQASNCTVDSALGGRLEQLNFRDPVQPKRFWFLSILWIHWTQTVLFFWVTGVWFFAICMLSSFNLHVYASRIWTNFPVLRRVHQ